MNVLLIFWKARSTILGYRHKKEARSTANERKESIICGGIAIAIILYITLISREPTLTRAMHLAPLWGNRSIGHIRQIALNIALFIPLGYFLTPVFAVAKWKYIWPIVITVLLSAFIEILQYFTYRGMLDVEDLCSNAFGASLGVLLYMVLERTGAQVKKIGGRILLLVSFLGCIIIVFSNKQIDTKLPQQFEFEITEANTSNELVLQGICYTYDRATPPYTIFVGEVETATDIQGDRFTANVRIPNEKVEVRIRFKGYSLMPTGTYINPTHDKVLIEYVSGALPIIQGLPEEAILKSRNTDYDVLIYQDEKRLLWLIGKEIDNNTEIIYHIYTDDQDLLPEKRKASGFDNRGFRLFSDVKAGNELESINGYRVFEKEIPEDYHVTSIVVGFNTDGKITWTDSFRVN